MKDKIKEILVNVYGIDGRHEDEATERILRLFNVVKPKGTFCQTTDNCQTSYYQQIGDYYCSKCEKTGLG